MAKNNKAFTLIELMVVIVIIGILAALAIPKFNEASVKAKASEAPTVLSSYDNVQLAYLAETNTLGDISMLPIQSPSSLTSKYYTYSQNAVGTYQCQAASTGMGKMAGAFLWTAVGTAGQITHTCSDGANVIVYLPNWTRTSN